MWIFAAARAAAHLLMHHTGRFTMAKKPGLWANIHAKRKRIKEGSGERMRKPGEEGAPTAKALRDSAKKKMRKS